MANVYARRRFEHIMFTGLSVILVIYALLGFWRTYFAAGLLEAPLPSPLVQVHALLFVGWITLFFIQNVLITTKSLTLHR